MLGMWMNESAANSILAPPVSGLKDALFRPSLPSKPKKKRVAKNKNSRTDMETPKEKT